MLMESEGRRGKVLQTRGASLQARTAKARLPGHLVAGVNVRGGVGGGGESGPAGRLVTVADMGREPGPKSGHVMLEESGDVEGWGGNGDGGMDADGGWEVGGVDMFRAGGVSG